MNNKCFFAVDLGATSGRTIIGKIDEEKVVLEEMTRFPNNLIQTGGQFYWDIYALYNEVIRGLRECARRGVAVQSIGIDTWGVDFVFVGSDGQILRNPRAYRDPHTFAAMDDYLATICDKRKLYDITGIQLMNFNTIFQLYAQSKEAGSRLPQTDKILFMPDLLAYMLTGEMVCEYTDASTSGLINPRTRDFQRDLLERLGINPSLLLDITQPGTKVGVLKKELCEETGMEAVPVIAVAGHDTASAIAAVPASGENFAYLSSGTWSLMGIESKTPIIDEKSYEYNLTNEGGIEGTTRFLKNITGMWLLEQSRKTWEAEGREYSYAQMEAMAREAIDFPSTINPDDPRFAAPKDMYAEIKAALQESGQRVPENDGEMISCIYHSLTKRYKEVIGMLQGFASFKIEKLHVIGGGSANKLMCQLTADTLGIPVIAGPMEGTAIGNIMLQAKVAGLVGDRWDMRRIIGNSIQTITYEPRS